jgi:hypothetical protein
MVKQSTYSKSYRKTHKRRTNWRRTQKKGGFWGSTAREELKTQFYKKFKNDKIKSPNPILYDTIYDVKGTPTHNVIKDGCQIQNYTDVKNPVNWKVLKLIGNSKFVSQIQIPLTKDTYKSIFEMRSNRTGGIGNEKYELYILNKDNAKLLLKSEIFGESTNCMEYTTANEQTYSLKIVDKNNSHIINISPTYFDSIEIDPVEGFPQKVGGRKSRRSRRGGSTCKTAIMT